MRTEISGIRQTLAAYSCGGSRGLASKRPQGAGCVPHSLIALSFERGHQTPLVQRCGPALSMAASQRRRVTPKGGLTVILLLSFPPPCITLPKVVRCSEPTAWGWRVKRESGECAQLACNSGTAPATVSESKAKLHVTAPRAWEDASPAPKAFASPETGLMSSSGYLRGGRIGLCAMSRRQTCAVGRPRQGS
jgi:hypothetical protein